MGAFQQLDDYTGVIDDFLLRRLNSQLCGFTLASVDAACKMLTTASLIVTAPVEDEVLVFLENSPPRICLNAQDSGDKPDLVAFFAPYRKAEQLSKGSGLDWETRHTCIPSSYELVSVAVTAQCTNQISQCWRYMVSLSSHKPTSCHLFGLVIDEDGFTLVVLGLNSFRTWPKVAWTHPKAIRKLCTCMQIIRKFALKTVSPFVPRLAGVIKAGCCAVGWYTVKAGGERFRLLPIYSRGKDGKPFVALGVADDTQDLRVFKYSWCDPDVEWREYNLLRRLSDVPGVVRIDERLSINSVETNESELLDGEEDVCLRRLLVLRTIGYPLCACESVLEFLEAMYDLLEVLRYLVQEKNILHRDVSWANVLIRPMNSGFPKDIKGTLEATSDISNGRIPHRYRFISDVFKEDEWKVRVALTDFDHAIDLSSCGESERKERTGTRIFMAADVLYPRTGTMPSFTNFEEIFYDASLQDQIDKYATREESDYWDKYYKNDISRLKWNIKPTLRNEERMEQSFRHGAVHDAESVFYLCLLFFNRMWPFGVCVKDSELREIREDRGILFHTLTRRSRNFPRLRELLRAYFRGDERLESFCMMLKIIFSYLDFPWYNASLTGRGEPYEFHLHDFMQRLFLKEIERLRADGDPIYVEENPLLVRVPTDTAESLVVPYPLSTQSFSNGESHERNRRTRSRNFQNRGRSDTSTRPAHYTFKSRLPIGGSGADEICTHRELRNGLSGQDQLVLPVERPKEMPSDFLEKFPDHTGRIWDVYWWKIREKLWFRTEKFLEFS